MNDKLNTCAWCKRNFSLSTPRSNGLYHYTSSWVDGHCICTDCLAEYDKAKADFKANYRRLRLESAQEADYD